MIKKIAHKIIELFCKELYITYSERKRFAVESRNYVFADGMSACGQMVNWSSLRAIMRRTLMSCNLR